MRKYRESPYNQMVEAIEFMDTLPIDNPTNSLWWCLHHVVWHENIDRVKWILNNKTLVSEIANHTSLPPDELRVLFRKSVAELKKTDR